MAGPPINFSIIVPTYNRPRRLEAFLRALTLLDYPRELFPGPDWLSRLETALRLGGDYFESYRREWLHFAAAVRGDEQAGSCASLLAP